MQKHSDETEVISFHKGNYNTLARHAKHNGLIPDPSGTGKIMGLCGDDMEFFILVENDTIKEVKFQTSGCSPSLACGEMASMLAEGRSVSEALGISAAEVLHNVKDLPYAHAHCTILAVSTLYKAISQYLLQNDF